MWLPHQIFVRTSIAISPFPSTIYRHFTPSVQLPLSRTTQRTMLVPCHSVIVRPLSRGLALRKGSLTKSNESTPRPCLWSINRGRSRQPSHVSLRTDAPSGGPGDFPKRRSSGYQHGQDELSRDPRCLTAKAYLSPSNLWPTDVNIPWQ